MTRVWRLQTMRLRGLTGWWIYWRMIVALRIGVIRRSGAKRRVTILRTGLEPEGSLPFMDQFLILLPPSTFSFRRLSFPITDQIHPPPVFILASFIRHPSIYSSIRSFASALIQPTLSPDRKKSPGMTEMQPRSKIIVQMSSSPAFFRFET